MAQSEVPGPPQYGSPPSDYDVLTRQYRQPPAPDKMVITESLKGVIRCVGSNLDVGRFATYVEHKKRLFWRGWKHNSTLETELLRFVDVVFPKSEFYRVSQVLASQHAKYFIRPGPKITGGCSE